MNEPDVTEELAIGNVSAPVSGSVARKYWLYIWNEHPYLPGMPAEFSCQPVIFKAADTSEALQEAEKLIGSKPKWEMYEGSGWSGQPSIASGHTPMKPLNDPSSATGAIKS